MVHLNSVQKKMSLLPKAMCLYTLSLQHLVIQKLSKKMVGKEFIVGKSQMIISETKEVTDSETILSV